MFSTFLRIFTQLFTVLVLLGSLSIVSPHSSFADENNIEVVVEGIGSSPESATKNAIEQALMQAVGRLIDTETIIKKKTEIENEIRSVSKTIDRSMLEYSQGVIDSYQQVAINQENGFYRVTALVKVRSKELTPLLDGVVSGNADLAGSLFSTFQVENEQQTDRLTLITDKILSPMLDWSAYELAVEQPILLKGSPTSSLFDIIARRTSVSGSRGEFYHIETYMADRMFEGRFNLAIPYTLKLTDVYMNQASDLLESTADSVEFDLQTCNGFKSLKLSIGIVSEFDTKCYRYDISQREYWSKDEKVKEILQTTKFAVQLFDQKNAKLIEVVAENSHPGHNGRAANLVSGLQFNCWPNSIGCSEKPLTFVNIGTLSAAQASRANSAISYTHPMATHFLLVEELQGVLFLSMHEKLAKRAANVQFGLQ